MNMRKIAAAAGFATGAALAFAPLASADTSSGWLSSIDSLLTGGALPAAATSDFQISYNGMDLFPTTGNLATATTVAGQFGLAIASGDGAKAVAEGGFGDSALASGTNALAEAGSTTSGATNFNFDSATDIGNNANPSTYIGAPDGAYAGGGSLIGGVDSGTGSSNDTAQVIGNMGTDNEFLNGGNSGAFAGDSALIGFGHTAGNADTAYTSGNISGFGDGSAAVAGNNDSAYTTGTETGTNEGAFSGFGNFNSATADTNYTTDGAGVSATFGNGNYAFVNGPNNSTADAGGTAAHLGNSNIAEVSDQFGATADNASAGSSSTAAGSNDLAEVLLTHGNASAQGGNFLYDIISLFGNFHSASLPAAADPAATDITSTVDSEIASLNALFVSEADLAGDGSAVVTHGANTFDTIPLSFAPDTGTPTFLDYELYGLNPIANAASDPGAYSVFNGALTEFDNAYNVELFSLLNPTAPIDSIPMADLFGSASGIAEALASNTASGAVTDFLTDGWNDLLGYL